MLTSLIEQTNNSLSTLKGLLIGLLCFYVLSNTIWLSSSFQVQQDGLGDLLNFMCFIFTAISAGSSFVKFVKHLFKKNFQYILLSATIFKLWTAGYLYTNNTNMIFCGIVFILTFSIFIKIAKKMKITNIGA